MNPAIQGLGVITIRHAAISVVSGMLFLKPVRDSKPKGSIRWILPLFLLIGCTEAAWAESGTGNESTKLPPAPMHEQVLYLPGDSSREPVKLQVTLYEPSGSGPFPLAIMNHGSKGDVPPKQHERYRFTYSAYYFLSRGYAVALPMMRGYAGSEGKEPHYGCDLARLGIENAKDIQAVIDSLSRRSEIDGTRIIMAGQSFGGWNTLAFGTLHNPYVKGLINFAGGVITSGCASSKTSVASSASRFGERTQVPSIWFYGDNDKIFDQRTWRSMYDVYVALGGKAELVAFGNFMGDAHQLLSYPEGLKIWSPKVDAFLEKAGLPSKPVFPEYLPADTPPPTHYASISDVDSVPYIEGKKRTLYQNYLNDPMPRAFVLAPNGWVFSFNQGFDPFSQAMAECKKYSNKCEPYAVDNDVVWVEPSNVPEPTHFAAAGDKDAVPYVRSDGRKGYEKFLGLRKPRAFVIAFDGGWSAASRGYDVVVRALASCSQKHPDCKLYAVDDDIVW